MELLDSLLEHLGTLENNSLGIKNKNQKDKLYLIKSKLDRIINTVNNCSHNIEKERRLNQNSKSDTQKNIIIHGFNTSDIFNKGNINNNVELLLSSQLGISVKVKEAVQLGKDSKSLLVKLNSVKEKVTIFRNCSKIDKKLKINIVEDLTRQEREERRKLIPELIKAKKNGFSAYFRRNKLIIKEKLLSTVKNCVSPVKLDNMAPDGQEPKEKLLTENLQRKHIEVSTCNEFKNDILKVNPDNSVYAEELKIEEVKNELIHSVSSNTEHNRKEILKMAMLETAKYKAHAKIVNQQQEDIAVKLEELNIECNKILKKKQSTNNIRKLDAIRKRSRELIEKSRRLAKELESQHNLVNVKRLSDLHGYDMKDDTSINRQK